MVFLGAYPRIDNLLQKSWICAISRFSSANSGAILLEKPKNIPKSNFPSLRFLFSDKLLVTSRIASLLLVFLVTGCGNKNKNTLNIAVASNFEATLKVIVEQYQQAHPESSIQIVAASSGTLANQILKNAPFDLFLSADTEKPWHIYRQLHLTNKPQIYAIGKLALWIPKAQGNQCLQHLKNLQTLAIANPKTAPYGKIAANILTHNAIKIKKVIHAGSIAQVYLYTQQHLTQAGFVPLSLVKNNTQGCLQIFQNMPLSQAMVVLRPEANDFFAYLLTAQVQNLIRQSGYDNVKNLENSL